MKEYNVVIDSKIIAEVAYNFDLGVKAATKLSIEKRPSAIFAGNDEMAVEIYYAARKAGMKIPQDLSAWL